jgi:hypothetical protein
MALTPADLRAAKNRTAEVRESFREQIQENPGPGGLRLWLAAAKLRTVATRLTELGAVEPPYIPKTFVTDAEAERTFGDLLSFIEQQQQSESLTGQDKSANVSKKPNLDARALALFFDDRTRTKSDIADLLHVKTQSLAPRRCPKLDAAIRANRAPDPNQRRIRGSKSNRTGNMEAWEGK